MQILTIRGGFKLRILKISRLVGEPGEQEETESPPLMRQHNKEPHGYLYRDTAQKEQFENSLGYTGGRVADLPQRVCQRGRDHWETSPGTKELASAISLHGPPAWTLRHLRKPAQRQRPLPNLLTALPVPVFSCRQAPSGWPPLQVLSHSRPAHTLLTPHALPLCSPAVWCYCNSGKPGLTQLKPKVASDWPH